MLLNSYSFISLFLAIALAGFSLFGKRQHDRIAISWLVACSLVFYGWWNPACLGLILVSILFNDATGVVLSGEGTHRKTSLVFGVALNLGLLGHSVIDVFKMDTMART